MAGGKSVKRQLVHCSKVTPKLLKKSSDNDLRDSKEVIDLIAGSMSERDYSQLLLKFQTSSTFEELQNMCRNIQLPHLEVGHMEQKTITYLKCSVDHESLQLMPDDVEFHDGLLRLPVDTKADGNCLAHAACKFLEDAGPTELRARIVIELVNHKEKYIDPDYLGHGVETGHALPRLYTMFSDLYCAGGYNRHSN